MVAPHAHVGHAGVELARLERQLALQGEAGPGEAAGHAGWCTGVGRCRAGKGVRTPHAVQDSCSVMEAKCQGSPPAHPALPHLGAVLVQARERVPVALGQVRGVVQADEGVGVAGVANHQHLAVAGGHLVERASLLLEDLRRRGGGGGGGQAVRQQVLGASDRPTHAMLAGRQRPGAAGSRQRVPQAQELQRAGWHGHGQQARAGWHTWPLMSSKSLQTAPGREAEGGELRGGGRGWRGMERESCRRNRVKSSVEAVCGIIAGFSNGVAALAPCARRPRPLPAHLRSMPGPRGLAPMSSAQSASSNTL